MKSVRLFIVAALLVTSSSVWAREIYVDNRGGNDLSTGVAPTLNDPLGGPVKSIRRALVLARDGDVIILRNNSTPYYEPIVLTGVRHNGLTTSPLLIQGNGATISGLMALPRTTWKSVGEELWQITPGKKGWYQLVRGNDPVPELRIPAGTQERPDPAPGHWVAWKGAIYYRSKPDENVLQEPFALAREDVGISLHRVRNVRIENLVVEHFRIDGINAHDGCRNVELVNVVSRNNGRAGLVAAGTSDIVLTNSKLLNNREYSLLVTERAAAEVIDSELTQPAVIAED